MIKIPSKNEKRLAAVKQQMNDEIQYTTAWFRLKEKWQMLFRRVERERSKNEASI